MRPARHRGVGGSGVALTLVALLVAGCSPSPREQARKGLESLHSWAVSARMVGERWIQGAIPDPYASTTLQTFGRKVRKERRKTSSGNLPSDVKEFLVAGLDSTAGAADSLLAAVNRNDKRAVPGIVRELSLRARAADSLAEQLGGK